MHGTFRGDPPRRDPPRRDPRREGGAGLSLALRILLREAASGCVLYAALGEDPMIDVLVCAAVWTGLVLLTLKGGLLKRRDRVGVFAECFVIFCGGLLFRNLLVLMPSLLSARP